MKKFIADLFQRATSRKFMVTVFGAVTLASAGQWTEFVGLLTAYLVAEGAGDAVERFKTGVGTLNEYVNPTSQNDDDEIDTTVIETGKGGIPLFNEEVKEDDK